MSNDNKTLADVQPGGRVRLGDRPKDGEVLVEVSGLTGSGKSAIAGEIEILCKALGLEVEWVNGDEEKRLTHADWIGALEMYKPKVVIVEKNIPRAALSAQPSPGGQDARAIIEEFIQCAALGRPHGKLIAQAKDYLAARQPVEFERAIPTRRRESAVELLLQLGFVWNNQRWEDRRQPVGEAVTVEAVATVRRKGDGERYIDWLTEGGIADLEAGDVLMVSDRAITDEYGSGEVYAAPPAQAVDLEQFRDAITREYANSRALCDMPRILECERLLALIDSQAVGK